MSACKKKLNYLGRAEVSDIRLSKEKNIEEEKGYGEEIGNKTPSKQRHDLCQIN